MFTKAKKTVPGELVGLLLVTALLAGYFSGRRAAATNPVRALRVD
jgi:ABC-type lipoprotein release transport system permease subunit